MRKLMGAGAVAVLMLWTGPVAAQSPCWWDGHTWRCPWNEHRREEWRDRGWREHEWRDEHRREWCEHHPYECR